MSRRLAFDKDTGRDLQPRRQIAEAEQSPDMICRSAASLLETLAPQSSEARRTAEQLRLLARAIVRAMAADSTERRRQAETIFGAESQSRTD